MSSGFWTGGSEAYKDALREQYMARLAELKQQLGQCFAPDDRSRLQREIEATRAEYAAKVRDIDIAIF